MKRKTLPEKKLSASNGWYATFFLSSNHLMSIQKTSDEKRWR